MGELPTLIHLLQQAMAVEYRGAGLLQEPLCQIPDCRIARALRAVATDERDHLAQVCEFLRSLGDRGVPPPLQPAFPVGLRGLLCALLRDERAVSAVYGRAKRVADSSQMRATLTTLQREDAAHRRVLAAALAELPPAQQWDALAGGRLWEPARPRRYDGW